MENSTILKEKWWRKKINKGYILRNGIKKRDKERKRENTFLHDKIFISVYTFIIWLKLRNKFNP